MSYFDGFYIPLGKALKPVETDKTDCSACHDCFLNKNALMVGDLFALLIIVKIAKMLYLS